MKRIILIAFVALFLKSGISQTVLVVNDNDNITYNTDTILIALNNSIYAGYDYWSIPDSGGIYPTAALMDTYDVVIWYASTDGLGLALWDGTTAGNAELVSHIITGAPVWIIGQDALYQLYSTGGVSFTAGEFAYDYMGLASYDVQSYADDGALGVPQENRVNTASAIFPDSLQWIFSTLWYVDGCTGRVGTLDLYQMGPTSYTLAGKKSMFHSNIPGNNVMSTFFDPALIDTHANRVGFMEAGITYLLGTMGEQELKTPISLKVYPNPASTFIQLTVSENSNVFVCNMNGQILLQSKLTSGKNEINIAALSAGVYFVKVQSNGVVQNSKLIIEK